MSNEPHILVIDDEPQIQRFLRPALTAASLWQVSAPAAGTPPSSRRQSTLHLYDSSDLNMAGLLK